MGRFLNLKLPHFSRRNNRVFLALFWFSGLLTGSALSVAASDSLAPMMRMAVDCCVSIDGLLTAILLPFLLSVFAVLIHEPWLLLPIAFGKAFLVSFLGIGVLAAYGSAGWLVRGLLMFSDCCTLPLLYWYWSRHTSDQRGSGAVSALVLVIAILIGSFDYCVVSPFLAAVIS